MPRDAGYLYAIRAEGTNYIKIGSTTGAVEKRLKVLQTGQPFPLTILAHAQIDRPLAPVEGYLHTLLKPYRQHGEWFWARIDVDTFHQLVALARARVTHAQLTQRLLAREKTLRRRRKRAEEPQQPKPPRTRPLSRKRTTPIPPEVQHMADRVYMLRHAKRLTQSALAKAVGCSTATISDLETKKLGSIEIAHLVGLARVLGTSTDALLGLEVHHAA